MWGKFPSASLTFNISEGRDHLFRKRMTALLETREDHGGPRNIVTHCMINNQPLNDKTIFGIFCPYIFETNDTENTASAIFTKIEKKTDPKFITKAFLELVEMKWGDQDKLMGALGKTHSGSDSWSILETFPKDSDAIKRVITRAFFGLSDSEKDTLVDFFQDRSKLKTRMKVCGSHDITVTCEYKDKDFCEGNSLSHHFGLAALFSMCLPGLVQGLSNLIFYQVDLFYCHTTIISNFITFQATVFPVGFGQEIAPKWPQHAVAKLLLQMLLIPPYLLFMVVIGPALPMFRYLIFNLDTSACQVKI